LPKQELNATLVQRIDLTADLSIMRFLPDGWEIPPYEPGQFAVLGLPGSAPRCTASKPEETPTPPEKFVQRAYSIASSPLTKDYIEFYITLVKDGGLTPRLFSLQPGDKVFLSPKISGFFTLQDAPAEANIVLAATGTGLAPFVSMLNTYLTPGPRRWAMLHGVRESTDLAYRPHFTMMERLCPNFAYFPIISRAASDRIPWKGHKGYVQDIWTSGALAKAWNIKPDPSNTHIYLCGNPLMIRDYTEILQKEGYKEHSRKEPGQIHVEKYW